VSAGGVSAQLDLAAIEARLKKAVRGPWRHDVDPRPDGADQIITAGGLAWITVAFMPTPAEKFYDTAQFIAHAPSDVAVLVEAVKALRPLYGELFALRQEMAILVEIWEQDFGSHGLPIRAKGAIAHATMVLARVSDGAAAVLGTRQEGL